MYWNDEELSIVPYERKQKKYFCGKELLKVEREHSIKYNLLILDLDEAYCVNVYNDNTFEKIFSITSAVPNKQRSGGQSSRRFERVRDTEIIHWFKRINEYINKVEGNLFVGINFVYKDRFKKYLSTSNLNKISKWDKTEYSGICGIYQYISKVKNEERV